MLEELKQYKNLLREFVRFQSVSTEIKFQKEIQKTAAWLKNLFQRNGFVVEVIKGYDNPIVVASYFNESLNKTVLVYGHYDVQPASKKEGWESEPFELREKNGRLYGRGVVDNKGQILVHIVSVIKQIKNNSLGYNVKFMIEGNEETGSPLLGKFIQKNKRLLKADFALISDGEIVGERPNIEVGFRGGFNALLTVKTSKTDLHSGLYGHTVPNAIHELAKVFAGLYDDNNRIVIPGFYDDVELIPEEIKKANQKIPFSLKKHKQISGAKVLLTEPGVDFYTQVGLLPAIEATTIIGGYMGEGFRNGIPSTATAKVNFRLVQHQKPEKIARLFKKYLRTILPRYVDFDFKMIDPYKASKIDTQNEYVAEAKRVLTSVYGREPIFKYVGGGLPIVSSFNQVLKIPSVLVPFANEDCAMHAVNENFDLSFLKKAMGFSRKFFQKKS